MRRSTNQISYQHMNQVFPINTHDGKYSCEEEILNSGISQLLAMLSYHSRVFTLRVDLHLREYEPSNIRISKLMHRLVKWMKCHYKMQRVGYLWVREKESAKSQHYHLMLYLDGNKIRYPAKFNQWICDYWTLREQPKPPRIKNCYSMITRGDKLAIDESVKRMSYLAKSRCKGYRSHYTKDYSGSRIQLKKR